MKKVIENRVVELFDGGKFLCAETVLSAIAEFGGREPKDVVAMATGFCSGMSRTCGQCGAVSGAVMGIGLFAGRSEPGGDYDAVYAMVQELLVRFREEYGSINCHDLIQCDFATPEGAARFKEQGLLVSCQGFAAFAAYNALELLEEHGYISSYEEHVRSQIAPCGLSCGKCLAYAGGEIQLASLRLADALGDNFADYAKRFEGMNPVFENYAGFRELLDFFTQGSCTSCRDKGCLFKSCRVTECAKEKGVDYCFQCDAFPCEEHGMPEGLAERWQANNETMREIGPELWFCGCKDRPRYP